MTCKQTIRGLVQRLLLLHRDQAGSLSITSVFAVILLVMLFGQVLNSGLQVDQKVKLQNAADAATYSGGVVVARSLNTLAFTNHLLADVFALTAYLREARDRTAEAQTVVILNNWERIGPALAGSEYQKFAELGQAIVHKVPREREVVYRFGDWAAAAAELQLPVFETILQEQMIPEFQRTLIRLTPYMAQTAVDEVARQHGTAWPQPAAVRGVLWRTDARVVAGSAGPAHFLPVVDPFTVVSSLDSPYFADATEQRFQLAHRYLRIWNEESLPLFDKAVKMSQFGSLWRVFAGGHLQQLLKAEFATSNLPCQILTRAEGIDGLNEHLEYWYMLVGVVYHARPRDHMPGIFRSPFAADQQAYAQVMVFVPRRRLVKDDWPPQSGGTITRHLPLESGVPGQAIQLPGGLGGPLTPPPVQLPGGPARSVVVRQDVNFFPEDWTLVNQNWTTQLVPATARNIPDILGTLPSGQAALAVDVPDLSRITAEDFLWLSNH